jgi:hypothetical protein
MLYRVSNNGSSLDIETEMEVRDHCVCLCSDFYYN